MSPKKRLREVLSVGVEKEESFVVFLARGRTPDSKTLCPRRSMVERKNTDLLGWRLGLHLVGAGVLRGPSACAPWVTWNEWVYHPYRRTRSSLRRQGLHRTCGGINFVTNYTFHHVWYLHTIQWLIRYLFKWTYQEAYSKSCDYLGMHASMPNFKMVAEKSSGCLIPLTWLCRIQWWSRFSPQRSSVYAYSCIEIKLHAWHAHVLTFLLIIAFYRLRCRFPLYWPCKVQIWPWFWPPVHVAMWPRGQNGHQSIFSIWVSNPHNLRLLSSILRSILQSDLQVMWPQGPNGHLSFFSIWVLNPYNLRLLSPNLRSILQCELQNCKIHENRIF